MRGTGEQARAARTRSCTSSPPVNGKSSDDLPDQCSRWPAKEDRAERAAESTTEGSALLSDLSPPCNGMSLPLTSDSQTSATSPTVVFDVYSDLACPW
eukprot:507317-Hanusia_phi.AAC.2